MQTSLEMVEQWLKSTNPLHKRLNPSAVLIGKIWTRLYFSLEKVCDENRPDIAKKSIGAGNLMELFALCVINAFYVEERDYHLSSGASNATSGADTDRTNPLKSAKFFIRKLKWTKNAYQELPLTYLVATCPLILGLLEPSVETNKLVFELMSGHPEAKAAEGTSEVEEESDTSAAAKLLCDQEIWDKLNRTYIPGMKWEKSGNSAIGTVKS